MLRVRDGGDRPRARTAIGSALVALACLATIPASSQAQIGSGVDEVLENPADVRAYWTPERMRNAIPLGQPTSAPALPAPKRGGTIAKRVRRPKRPPNRTHGKVFFRDGLLDYVCSGTALRSPSKSVVWTAGHCVHGGDFLTGGAFFKNWEFVPAYRNGNKPFGEYPAQKLASTSQWKQSSEGCPPGGLTGCGDSAHDFGAAVVAKAGGSKLQQRVGGRGIVFGAPRDQVYRPFGYPAAPPFNGKHMYKCRSGYKGADNSQGNPPPMRIRCDMTGGSSGGGWVTSGGDVASVVSYGYIDEPNKLYGPYQGASARGLYNDVKNG